MTRARLVIVPDDWARPDPPEPFDPAAYAASLPDASGTFTGTFDPAVVEELFTPPELFPVEVSTGDKPNPLAMAQKGYTLILDTWGSTIRMTVDRIEPLAGNRVRAWVRHDSVTTTQKDADG